MFFSSKRLVVVGEITIYVGKEHLKFPFFSGVVTRRIIFRLAASLVSRITFIASIRGIVIL